MRKLTAGACFLNNCAAVVVWQFDAPSPNESFAFSGFSRHHPFISSHHCNLPPETRISIGPTCLAMCQTWKGICVASFTPRRAGAATVLASGPAASERISSSPPRVNLSHNIARGEPTLLLRKARRTHAHLLLIDVGATPATKKALIAFHRRRIHSIPVTSGRRCQQRSGRAASVASGIGPHLIFRLGSFSRNLGAISGPPRSRSGVREERDRSWSRCDSPPPCVFDVSRERGSEAASAELPKEN